MVGSEPEKKKRNSEGKQWRWVVIGAIIALIFAFTTASITTPNINLFGQPNESCSCPQKYSGMVEDCCCDYETVDRLNEEVLHPSLQDLVKTPFFRYFKVKLWCDCPFWPDDGMCRLRDCSVCECPEGEFPESFRTPFRGGLPSDNLLCQEGKPQAAVDRTLDSKAFRGWTEIDNPWTNDDETDNAEMTYVNLQLNPERYTGYTGPSARRIWDAVYSENCPRYPSEELCQEERILYKLISGLHSSISIHIAADYLLDESKNLWGQNLTLMYDRVLRYPDRVRNLYFSFLFVLRAVTKAAEYLEQAEYDTGNPTEDLRTHSLMRQLLYNSKLQAACPLPFDEAKLWKGQRGPELKQKIQERFRNISALMDCVGCEKCRLWGKLQVLGLGTALKILFSDNGREHLGQTLQLQRNEVIALMNLLNRLSESVKLVPEMGPAVELSIGQISSPFSPSNLWQRVWGLLFKS
ncbi:endoplasmic reticulum oxidoreductin-1 [Ricinus communis]|uniref:endoplasmic reticulum oxidoreductin-1 n=1 Tax=Ricinus communis TaxID=3988 RepID=UPI0007726BAD|nr:endoplasmic reticulum oxidoreductin-1 [Ricinus communis]|eukprot:XP_015583960.1 endoplasmic reticulum oxidoreductin-1 [Ricinus communis]